MIPHVSNAFGLVVRFRLRLGQEENFERLVAETVPRIHEKEPGTLLYLCQCVEGKPAERIFYELYRDRAAFEAHEEQVHTRRFLAEREKFVESFEVDFLSHSAAAGAWLPGT